MFEEANHSVSPTSPRHAVLLKKCEERGGTGCPCEESYFPSCPLGPVVKEYKPEPEREYVPATVKPDWQMPDMLPCVECGKTGIARAVLDGSEWLLSCDCEDCCDYANPDRDPFVGLWPFVEDYAWAQDFEALGFVAEMA